MGMKKCKECGEEVSDKAKTCPKCGVDNPGKKIGIKEICGGICGGIFVLAIISAMLGGGDGGSSGGVAEETLITSSPSTLLLTIQDFDETGWKLEDQEDNAVDFIKVGAGGLSVDSFRQTVSVYNSIDEAKQAYTSELPSDISTEPMRIGDEGSMWEDAGGQRATGVFRENNVVCKIVYVSSGPFMVDYDMKKQAKNAHKKIVTS